MTRNHEPIPVSGKDCLIIGAGGHATVVADTLLCAGIALAGFLALSRSKDSEILEEYRVLGDDSFLANLDKNAYTIAIGIGSLPGSTLLRIQKYDQMRSEGRTVLQVIHPSAIVGKECSIGPGAQIFSGAIIQPRTSVGANCIINTGSRIDHHCTIGDNVHIAPGATVCGDVIIGHNVHIGAGAVILQGITIGPKTIVGAGAVVIDDLPASVTAVGMPAIITGSRA